MKNSKLKTLLSISFLAFFLLGHQTSINAQDATFDETIEWMKGKLENFKRRDFSNLGGVSNRWRYNDYYTYKVLSWDNCSMKIEQTMKHVTTQTGTRNDYTRTNIFEFNFGDLKSIAFDITSSSSNKGFLIKTLNDAKKIVKNPDGSSATILSEFWIQAEDLGDLEGEPERFTKAFKYAMGMCDAKEEKF